MKEMRKEKKKNYPNVKFILLIETENSLEFWASLFNSVYVYYYIFFRTLLFFFLFQRRNDAKTTQYGKMFVRNHWENKLKERKKILL